MKTGRLDEILLRLGFADEGQITRALERQETRGGRIGQHLVEMGVLTEVQLAQALGEQFDLPWVESVEFEIDEGLVDRMPAGVVVSRAVLPLAWEASRRVLRIVLADPTDQETLERVEEAFGARMVTRVLAPESAIRSRVRELTGAEDPALEDPAGIELPELFETEEEDDDPDPVSGGPEPATVRVLMVVEGAAYRNFLPAVFLREGCRLTVTWNREETREALVSGEFDRVLVSKEMAGSFTSWVQEEEVPAPDGEVTLFTSVSEALLENPAPYDLTVRSLRAVTHALAEERAGEGSSSPPYGLMAEDLEGLARRFRMRRLAVDGLHLAVHHLLPGEEGGDGSGAAAPFRRFPSSLELATRIRFPFRLDAVLGVAQALFRGRIEPDEPGEWGKEVHLAAQMLALIWYRHVFVPRPGVDGAPELGPALRAQAGRLSTLEVIEAYLRLVDERGEAGDLGRSRDVLLVGESRLGPRLAPRLRRMGCRTVAARDLDDARVMVERRAPAAVVVGDESLGDSPSALGALGSEGEGALVYVVTEAAEPSRTLALLDAGADDVFGPPHDFDLVAARISRAVRARPRTEEAAGGGGDFSASFQVFSFLDLIQALSHSHRTVRIDLEGGDDESATIWLDHGRTVHAVSGTLSGEEAVHRVIAWEDDGSFTVHPDVETGERSVEASTESVIMEGCRRLDEGVSPGPG
jgi:hypothetical protein